jgi:DNA-binding FadR family transcriptional regulator
MPHLEPPPKAAQLIAAEVRERIVNEELTEGDWLPREAEMSVEFGVSRPTVREALRLLEADGLVVVRRGAGGGAQVRLPTERVAADHAALVLRLRKVPLTDVFAARVSLEGPAVGVLASQRTDAQLERLRAIARDEKARREVDPRGEIRSLNEFHRAVIEMAGNETITFLSMMVQSIVWDVVEAWADETGLDRGALEDLELFHTHHERLIDLLEARDAEGAERLWRRHLEISLAGQPEGTGQIRRRRRR